MQMVLSRQDWEALELAQRQERGVRNWRRYQAIRLLAQGQSPAEVAKAVGCRESSVYNWVAAWTRRGNAGLHEDHHGGRTWLVEGMGQRGLERLLATDPQEHGEQATEWTVPLLLTHLQEARSGWATRPCCASSRHCGPAGHGWASRNGWCLRGVIPTGCS
jgi:transposase